ncbi:reverse transcriptase domain-containing protein [Trichonephila clavipes]|nr:reverse transcriptase domain-containing protein [Trichonephila clavipes]
MTELQKALTQAHNTSPGPDGITYTMLRHLHPNSLANILFFQQSLEGALLSSSRREAIVIPILKPGKVATDPLSYRPIALTSCFSVRYFNVRIGHSSSHKFIQDQGVPQGSVLSVTLFNIHMSNILHQLPPSVRGTLPRCPSDLFLLPRGLLSLVNTGFTNPGNPSEPSLFSALFLAIPISLFFFSTSGAHFRVSTGGHVPEVPE